jgi:hypothetical protein
LQASTCFLTQRLNLGINFVAYASIPRLRKDLGVSFEVFLHHLKVCDRVIEILVVSC